MRTTKKTTSPPPHHPSFVHREVSSSTNLQCLPRGPIDQLNSVLPWPMDLSFSGVCYLWVHQYQRTASRTFQVCVYVIEHLYICFECPQLVPVSSHLLTYYLHVISQIHHYQHLTISKNITFIDFTHNFICQRIINITSQYIHYNITIFMERRSNYYFIINWYLLLCYVFPLFLSDIIYLYLLLIVCFHLSFPLFFFPSQAHTSDLLPPSLIQSCRLWVCSSYLADLSAGPSSSRSLGMLLPTSLPHSPLFVVGEWECS